MRLIRIFAPFSLADRMNACLNVPYLFGFRWTIYLFKQGHTAATLCCLRNTSLPVNNYNNKMSVANGERPSLHPAEQSLQFLSITQFLLTDVLTRL